jgi:cytochrome c biogenesis protein CcmG/thiol:disulfide interchange protein DsbE
MTQPNPPPPDEPEKAAETPKRPLWAFLPLVLAGGIVAAALVVLFQGGERAYVTNDVAGRPLPAFDLPALTEGQPRVTNADFAGGAYLINSFASWCVPCRAEHPVLVALAEEGVPIMGLAYKDDPEATQRFLAELGDPYARVGVDLDGAYALDLGTSGVPETFVVGADGRMIAVVREPLTPETVERLIRPALQQGATPG